MFHNHTKFRRSLLAMSIIALGSPTFALAQTAPESAPAEDVDEVLVLGVRGAQQSAINTKRNATTIVDGISAEDIGKLPDTTITDSLQRITGVQIQRDAGEGGALSIRGMSQVALLLNGEQYLAAGNIAAAQPDLNDVPAQLLRGSQVYKSLDVRNAQSGITGTINIQTFRPLDFKDGLSLAGGIEESKGDITKKNDPTFNALMNWRNDKVGVMLSGVTGTKNLAKNYAGSAASAGAVGTRDAEGVYRLAEATGFEAFNQAVERERDGVNTALQVDLGNGFELVAEAFYTKAKSYDRRVGFNISNRWTGDDNFPNETPTHISKSISAFNGDKWNTVDEYDVHALWLKSYTVNDVTSTDSKNFNVELNYNNGGPFTGSLRAIRGTASQLEYHANAEGDFSDWGSGHALHLDTFYPESIAKNYTRDPNHTEVGVGTPDPVNGGYIPNTGGYYVLANPLGYSEDPYLHLKRKSFNMTWDGFNNPIQGGLGNGKTLADYLANKDSQSIAGYSMDGNSEAISDLNAFSLKGKYAFEDDLFIKDIELGLRKSTRNVDMTVFSMLAPFYVGSSNFSTSPDNPAVNVAGCMAQWKSIDQQFQGGDDGHHSQCSAGERLVGQENDPSSFTPYTVNRPTKFYENGAKIKFVTDLGSYAHGIPGFWAVDPHTFDDPIAFQNRTFGSSSRLVNPSSSYSITLDEVSTYLTSNFATGIFSGNLGARVIQTTLETIANTTNGVTVANGDTTIATGKVKTENKETKVLPALNLSASVADDIKIRFAAAKTKQDLDLTRYGSSLGIDTYADPSNPGIRIPRTWNSQGNPNLKPWLATNLDLSAEYYVGEASLFSLGVYHIKIDSFVASTSYNRDITVNGKIYNLLGDGPAQGEGGKVEGIELAAKLALSDFTSGALSNYGIDANYTYSPSETKSEDHKDLGGEYYPFPDNSKNTANLTVWYQKEKLQARIALNYRGDRFISDQAAYYIDDNGDRQSTAYSFSTWELGATYVDASVSYDVMDNLTVYIEGSNITGTDTKQTYRLKDGVQQDGTVFENEVRYSLGLRAKF